MLPLFGGTAETGVNISQGVHTKRAFSSPGQRGVAGWMRLGHGAKVPGRAQEGGVVQRARVGQVT